MKTYQDLLELGENESARMDFVREIINQHKNSPEYRNAVIAEDYAKQQNTTIMRYRKTIYNLQGREVDDLWSANYKLPSGFFPRFVMQENQYLLGNGITWDEASTKDRLGKQFDTRVQQAGKIALTEGCAFGFWDMDKLRVFKLTEFAPLYDEENGALRAGVRFWQLTGDKPLRATFYEEDGFTEYRWKDGAGEIIKEKRPYILKIRETQVDGMEIYDGENYPSFPIIPLWGNDFHGSELMRGRSKIDAYDLIESGFANDLDNAQIYWILHNTGGMDDLDLSQFIERLKFVGAAVVDDTAGTGAEAHTVEIPHEARDSLLELLRKDIYRDFMALDVENIVSGAITATQIRAAYEALNSKTDEYEYNVLEFLHGVLNVIGIDDSPTFTRSVMVNVQEGVQTLVQAAPFLDDDYVTEKIMTLLGDKDKVDEVLSRRDADDIERIEE